MGRDESPGARLCPACAKRAFLREAVAGIALAASMTFAACSGAGQEGDHEPPTEAARPVRIYAVRGHVVSLPADNGGEIRVAHEAIHDFVSAAGEVVGMDSMTMSFPLAKDVDISALTVGDAVELQLRIDWSEDDPAVVTQLARLPDGTQLVFGEATPPASVRE